MYILTNSSFCRIINCCCCWINICCCCKVCSTTGDTASSTWWVTVLGIDNWAGGKDWARSWRLPGVTRIELPLIVVDDVASDDVDADDNLLLVFPVSELPLDVNLFEGIIDELVVVVIVVEDGEDEDDDERSEVCKDLIKLIESVAEVDDEVVVVVVVVFEACDNDESNEE